MTKKTYTVPEAAKLAGIGRNSMYDAIRRGQVPAVRIGRRLVVPIHAFERFLLATTAESKQQ